MSEKVTIEFKFKIGDRVRSSSQTTFVVHKQEFTRSREGCSCIWYHGYDNRDDFRTFRESDLTFAEPPLTIKEVLEMVQENGFRSNPTGCRSCELTNQILKRGIVP